MAERRVTIPLGRYDDLVIAASFRGCLCADPENRKHDGKCISCWALAKRIEHIRALIATSAGASCWSIRDILDRCQAEQRWRAEQIPAAERRLAEARKEDEVPRG